jgi:hypothetical protein
VDDLVTRYRDPLPPAIPDLKDVLVGIRDELSSLHEATQNVWAGVESLYGEVRMLRKVLEEVAQALGPLHHLSAISNSLDRLARHGL